MDLVGERFWACPACLTVRRKSLDLEIYSSGKVVGKIPKVCCLVCAAQLDYRALLDGRYDTKVPEVLKTDRSKKVGLAVSVAIGLVGGCGLIAAGVGPLGATAVALVAIAAGSFGWALLAESVQAAALRQYPQPEHDVAPLEQER